MFAALVVSQAHLLRETVVVLQQPGGGNYGSTIPGLVGKSVALIVAIAFLNLNYAINEIKAIVAEAVQFAQESPEPDPSELYTDVYVEA